MRSLSAARPRSQPTAERSERKRRRRRRPRGRRQRRLDLHPRQASHSASDANLFGQRRGELQTSTAAAAAAERSSSTVCRAPIRTAPATPIEPTFLGANLAGHWGHGGERRRWRSGRNCHAAYAARRDWLQHRPERPADHDQRHRRQSRDAAELHHEPRSASRRQYRRSSAGFGTAWAPTKRCRQCATLDRSLWNVPNEHVQANGRRTFRSGRSRISTRAARWPWAAPRRSTSTFAARSSGPGRWKKRAAVR